MSAFKIGQKVYLAANCNIIFEIIRINYDNSYEIQVKNKDKIELKYDNVSAEMLRLVEDKTD